MGEIQNKAAEIRSWQVKLQEAGVEKSRVDSELETLRAQNGALKAKLQENLATLESNANMIKWLNKQLNERGSAGVTGMHTPTSFTK